MIFIIATILFSAVCIVLTIKLIKNKKNYQTSTSILDKQLKDKDLTISQLTLKLKNTSEEINVAKRYSTGLENTIAAQKTSTAETAKYINVMETALYPSRGAIKALFPEFFITDEEIGSNGIFYKTFNQGNLTLITCGGCGVTGISGRTKALLNIVFLSEIMQKTSLETVSAGQIIDFLRTKYEKMSENRQYRVDENLQVNITVCIVNQKERFMSFAGAFSSMFLVRKSYPGTSRKEVDVHEFRGEKMNFTLPYGRRKNYPSEKIELEKDDKIYLKSESCGNNKTHINNRFNDLYFCRLLMKIGNLPIMEQNNIFKTELENNNKTNDFFLIGIALKIKNKPQEPIQNINFKDVDDIILED